MIGLAHGSRHPDVRDSIDDVLTAVREAADLPVVSAFLDLTDPDLMAAVETVVAAGHTRAVVVPLLFTSAFHATVDVPEAVTEAAARSGLNLVVADILGTGDDMLAVVRASMAAAGIGDVEPVLLFSVGSSNAAANDAVHDLAVRLGATRPGAVRAGFGTSAPRGTAVAEELQAEHPDTPVAVVPLFVSPGLLLDPMARLAAERGWTMAPPLGRLVAPVVVDRYRAAL